MAQQFSPYGLTLYNTVDSNYSGTLKDFPIASGTTTSDGNPIYSGDPIMAVVDQEVAAQGTTISKTPAIGAVPILGVFQGVTYTNSQGQKIRQNFWNSGTTTFSSSVGNIDGEAKLLPAKGDQIFKIQASGNLANANLQKAKSNFLFRNAKFLIPSAAQLNLSAQNGVSGYALDVTTLNNGNGGGQFPLFIVGIASTPNSNIGNQWTDPYPDLLVILTAPAF